MFVNLDACMASQAVTLAVHAKLQVGGHQAAPADVADAHAGVRHANDWHVITWFACSLSILPAASTAKCCVVATGAIK